MQRSLQKRKNFLQGSLRVRVNPDRIWTRKSRLAGGWKGGAMDESERARLLLLIEEWERRARSAYASADHWRGRGDDFAARFIDHGAVCYANCATDLRVAIKALGTDAASPGPAPTPPPLRDDGLYRKGR